MNQKLKWCLWVVFSLALCGLLCACSGSTLSAGSEEETPTIENCWVCGVYGSSFQVANDIANSVVAGTISIARCILGVGLLFLLLHRVGSILLFKQEKEMITIMKETAFVFLKAMFVSFLLWNSDTLLGLLRDYIIYPVGQFLIMLSNAIMDCLPGTGQYFAGIEGITPDMTEIVVGANGEMVNIDSNLYGDLAIQVQYVISRIYQGLFAGGSVVRYMLTTGGMMAWVLALVFGWQMFSLMIVFPLAFVDSFIMTALYITFVPIGLALWVFPETKGMFKDIIPEIVQGFLRILFGCILVVLIVTLMEVFSDMAGDGILRDVTGNKNSGVMDNMAAGRPGILIMIILIISLKKMGACVGEFATYFTGVSSDTSVYQMMDKVKQALRKVRNAGKEIVIAVATSGASSAASAAKVAAEEAAKKAAEEAAKKAAETAADATSGGEGKKEGDS